MITCQATKFCLRNLKEEGNEGGNNTMQQGTHLKGPNTLAVLLYCNGIHWFRNPDAVHYTKAKISLNGELKDISISSKTCQKK